MDSETQDTEKRSRTIRTVGRYVFHQEPRSRFYYFLFVNFLFHLHWTKLAAFGRTLFFVWCRI